MSTQAFASASSFHLRVADPPGYVNPLAVVLRVLPWSNGISLQQGSMSEQLLNFWETSGLDLSSINSSLQLVLVGLQPCPLFILTYPFHKTQAQQLDSFTFPRTLLQDDRTQRLLQRLATVDRESFISNGGWSGPSSQDLDIIATFLVRHHLLDRFVDALGFPRQPTLPMSSQIQFPYKMPFRLQYVCLIYLLHD